MMRFILLSLLSTLGAFSAPEWAKDLSPSKVGSHPPVSSSELEFSLSWKGMLKAGVLDIKFAPKDSKKAGSFVIKSSASSRGAAAALYSYSHNYWSEINPHTLHSEFFHSTESYSDETVTTTNRYFSSKVFINEKSVESETGKSIVEKVTFPFGPARDIFSAMLHIRSQKLNTGDKFTLLLLPFKSPYLLKVRVDGREKHMSKDSIKLSFSLRKIDRDTYDLVEYKKLKKPVILWLSDDSDRVPLELRASVYIGDIRAVLTGWKKTP